jgi:hypothetical protein
MIQVCVPILSMVLCCAFFTAPAALAGEIAGRVIDGLTGKGITRARVVVTAGDTDRMVLSADDEGAFRVLGLPAAWIQIWAEQSGYFGGPYGPSTDESRTALMMSQTADTPATVTLKLTPQSVIEGKATTGKGAGVALVR